MSEMLTVDVALEADGYSVWIGEGLLAHLAEKIRPFDRGGAIALITDTTVGAIYGPRVADSLRDADYRVTQISVAAGEASKSLATVARVCDEMIAGGLDRNSLVIALGGGVVGDIAGFVAGIYYRGIPVIQVPTTIVAQVDSAVGGKTGVNAPGGKNLIGVFHQPAMVVADPSTLRTLPDREFNEGFAEIIKHAAIRDPEMLALLRPDQREDLVELIARNVAIKARIVVADEKETSGERALLNFGHTIGHAIEQAAGYGQFLHGEAISIGLHAALLLSVRKAGLSGEEAAQVLAALEAFHLPTRLPADMSEDAILNAMARDKKFESGRIRFVLTERLGSAFVSSSVSGDDIRTVLAQLR